MLNFQVVIFIIDSLPTGQACYGLNLENFCACVVYILSLALQFLYNFRFQSEDVKPQTEP